MENTTEFMNSLRNEYGYKKVYSSETEDLITAKLESLIIKNLNKEIYYYKKILLLNSNDREMIKSIDYIEEIDYKVNNIVKDIEKLDTYSKILLLEDISMGLEKACNKYMEICLNNR